MSHPGNGKGMCGQHELCGFPMYECLFSRIMFTLPFNDFEVGILNYLEITPSQLHPMSYAYVKVFQH